MWVYVYVFEDFISTFFYGQNYISLVSMHSPKMLPIKTFTTLHACPTKKKDIQYTYVV